MNTYRYTDDSFQDTTISDCYHPEKYPISAMNYHGVFFEDLIDSYRTLSVEGREMINVDIQSDKMQVGSAIINQTLPHRVLTVKYHIRNDDPQQLLVEYRKLMNYLYVEANVKIWFNDERDMIYYGRYSTSEVISGSDTSLVASFTIFCENPVKKTAKVFDTDGFIRYQTHYKTFPESIEAYMLTSKKLEITNGKETLKLRDGAVNAGDIVEFDFLKKEVRVNGKRNNRALELTSDFENFQVRQYTFITSSQARLKIKYRGVSL